MDVKEAFANSEFGTGDPMPHEREPASESTPVDKRDAVDAAPASASESKTSDRDDRDDDEGSDERPQDLEKALKALDSERSIRKEHRKSLKAEAAAKRDLEARYAQAMERLAALERQGAPQPKPEAPKVPELSDDDFYAKGPEYTRALMAQREQALVQQRIAPLEQRVAMTQIVAAEEAWRATHPDYDEKKALAQEHMRSSQDLRDEFNRVASGQHPVYRSIAHFVYEYAQQAERIGKLLELGDPAEIAARLSGESSGAGSSEQRPAAQRRTPLTLAGRPGGGASVTPAVRETSASELAFPNF